ncbi:hypothetical protein HKD37_19G053800 [Glycine soja]
MAMEWGGYGYCLLNLLSRLSNIFSYPYPIPDGFKFIVSSSYPSDIGYPRPLAGRVRVRGRDESNNPIPVLDFWLSGKILTRIHTRSTRVLSVKVGTKSDGYPWIRVFLPCLPNMFYFENWKRDKKLVTKFFFLITLFTSNFFIFCQISLPTIKFGAFCSYFFKNIYKFYLPSLS